MDIKKRLNEELAKRVLYSAVVLDDESHGKLLSGQYPYDFPDGWKVYGHHMTIIFGKGLDALGLDSDIGKTVELTVTECGLSDKAMAVKVEGYETINKTPHITLAVGNGGKPVDSNKIIDWQPIENPFTIKGTITEILR